MLHERRTKRLVAIATSIVLAGAGFVGFSSHEASADPTSVRLNAPGVDTCSFYSAATWNDVKNGSAKQALGFYMGGKTAELAVGCFIPGQTWIDNLYGSWRLIPIWDALQAPCEGATYKISTDPDTATSQGKTSGNTAADRMAYLNFAPGAIAYLDIEFFSGSASCESVTKRYVAGFVNRMHANGYLAGLYTSSCGPDADMYAGIASPPDDIWVAAWNGEASVLAADMGACFSGAHWTDYNRLHQYQSGAYHTWGGHTVNVDLDCVRGDVVGLSDYAPGC